MYDVCIIGGGQSGLTSLKTFKESGYKVILLEKCMNCNGMFSTIKEKDYFKWSTSRYMSGFSDFPMNKNIPVWFSIQTYVDYLNDYKQKFNLEPFIQYNSQVYDCKQNNNEWTVYFNNNDKQIEKLMCKKLIICTGLNQTPKFPDNLNNFKGEIIHTEYVYRNMTESDWSNKFTNKRILILGGSESAFDIGHVTTKYSNDIYFSTKNYIEWFYTGAELDKNIERSKKIKDKCLQKHGNMVQFSMPTDTQLNFPEYSLPQPMSNFWHNYGRSILLRDRECGKCSHQHKKLCDINETPENLFKKYVVKRTEFLLDIFEEKVKVIHYPNKFDGYTVITEKEVIPDVDIIICATGFKKEFPFLNESVYDCEFIKKMIPVSTPNISFIGFARPTMGSIAAVAEMQSWWTEEYFSNTLKYSIRKPLYRNIDVLDLENDHINSLVIGCFYIKDLAKDMNLEPNLIYLFFNDFELFKTIYTGSCHPMVYRIHGKKSYDGSRDVLINTFPKFEEHSDVSKKYYTMFLVFHTLFIIFCIIIAYILTYIIYFFLKIKYKKIQFSDIKLLFYILALILLWYFYTLE